jgi:hypothetical protein
MVAALLGQEADTRPHRSEPQPCILPSQGARPAPSGDEGVFQIFTDRPKTFPFSVLPQSPPRPLAAVLTPTNFLATGAC